MGDLTEQIIGHADAKRAVWELPLSQKYKDNGSPAIPRLIKRAAIALSFAQQRLWLLSQLEPNSAVYNETNAARLMGPLNVPALQKAVDGIVARHEALRTTFVVVDGVPVQVIGDPCPVELKITDLSYECGDRDETLDRFLYEEATRPFNLSSDLMLRASLLRLAPEEHMLFLVTHHIATDGWSVGVIFRELGALYEAFSFGRPSPLLDLPVQYADYTVWQREQLSDHNLAAELSYWNEQLSGLPNLALPVDRPRPPAQTFKGARQSIQLSTTLTNGLKALSRQERVSLYATLLAAFKTLLYRYTQVDDIVVGSPIGGRDRTEVEGLVGPFINNLVLRTDFSGEPSFRELLGRVWKVASEAYKHQDLPFEKLVEELQPDKSLSHSPLFQVMFILQPSRAIELTGLTVTPVVIDDQTAKFDLTLSMVEEPDSLEGFFEYNTDLFDGVTVDRMIGHFEALLDAIVADPEQRLSQLSMLSKAEREQLLVGLNATQSEYPRSCVHALFEAQAGRTPDAVAVIGEGEQLTYRELDERAERLADRLRAVGVRPGVLVGICLERSADLVVGLLGILKSGGAYVPIDPAYPAERKALMIEDSAMTVLLAQERVRGDMPQNRCRVLSLEQLASEGELHAGEVTKESAGAENLAYVIYTSGSTGRPKGVEIQHKALVNFLHSMRQRPGLTPQDVSFSVTTISFDIAGLELFLPLLVGACVVIVSREVALDGRRLMEQLENSGATVMQATPATWRMLIDVGWSGKKDLKILCGGEALAGELASQLLARGASLWNLYGPTESTIWSTLYRVETVDGAVPIGRPIANTEIYILDRYFEPVPLGVPGELYIGGVGLARGYLNRPELTEEKFIGHPFSADPSARLYKTGDLARYRADGNIEYLGRLDHQVKIRGFRIELGEIESVLSQHPAVSEAVVMAREDEPGDRRLVAYIVPSQALVPAVNELRNFLKSKLPDYMVPSAFVELGALPLTPNGKIDRKALPAPEHSDFLRTAYVAPRTVTEELLAGIWGKVLGLERVGVHDNFFELGGHSLLAVNVIDRVRRAGLNADVSTLYLTPTIAALAAVAGGDSSLVEVPANRIPPNCEAICPEMLPLVQLSPEEIAQVVAAVPGAAANVQDIYPLAPLQEGLLFHHRMTSGGGGYLTRTLYGFDSRDRLDRYLQALQAVIDRNDILRTAVLWEGLPQPVQVVYRKALLLVEEVSLEAADGDVARQLRERFNPRTYRLDVRQAPLLRLFIAHDAVNGRWLMQQMVHHLIDDQITMQFVQDEIRAHLLGHADRLPAPLPFRNFVAQARLGVPAEEHEAFFRELLGGVDETTAPFGLSDVQGDGSGIAEARSLVDPVLERRLRQAGHAVGVSAASVFHLAWAQVLARLSGREDVVFGTVLLGRMQGGVGTERVLGTCINTLPVRLRVGDASVKESVLSTHTLLARLLRHEHAQLALAQRCSAVAVNAPLFSALLNYRYGEPERQSVTDGVEVLDFEERTNYPVTLCVDDTGEGFRLVAQVESPVDPERVCAYMHTALEQLVVALESSPAAPLRSLDVLPDAERRQVVVEWNDTARNYGHEARLHRLIERQAAQTPDCVALEFEGQTLSYLEVNERANQLARLLRRKGVGPDVLVGVFAERSFEMVLALLATLKAGGAYVPLDPSYPAERLAHMLEDARTLLVLAQPHLASQLPPQAKEVHLLDGSWAAYAHESGEDLEDIGTPQNLAYVIFTSGSTGRPKGAMNEHGGICNRLLWMQEEYGLSADDRVLQKTQFSFDVSTWEFFWPLLAGARLVIARPEGHRDSAYLKGLIRECGITALHFVPSMLRVFLEQEGLEGCCSLKRVFCSGEALPHELQERFFARLPEVELHNLYGPTEAAVDVTYWACRKGDDCLTVPIGRPVANTQMYALDARMRPAPVGVAGELYIGGVQVGRGYVGRDDLTAERFVADPFSKTPDARLYKTGDLARHLPDGAIEYLGRLDYQVKIRGQRIELGEIEATLDKHAGVGQSVVMAREDTPGDQRLVAYVVARQAASSTEELREHLSRQLPAYMVPSAFVFLEALPLTSSGKVDRKLLPVPERSGSEATYVAPRTVTEEILAGIWSRVLGLERVGVHDNFFELGGHSLLAVSVIDRMHRAGLNADVRTLFIAPTIAALAAMSGGGSGLVEVPPNGIPPNCDAISPEMLPLVQLSPKEIAQVVAAVPGGAANIQDIYPLAPLQEGFLFHHRMVSEGDTYLMTYQFAFDSRDRLGRYLQALQAVIDRHDILRTAVLWEGLAEPVQVVYRRAPLIVEEVSLDAAGGDMAQQLRDRINLRNYRLDVRQVPLMRVFIAHDAANDRWLMQQMVHHLIEDQATMKIQEEEIQSHLLGHANQLPAPLPFRNFVAQSRLGVAAEEHEAFFRELLGDVDEPTAPFGLSDVQGDGSGIQEGFSLIDAALARRLREMARAVGVSAASMFHLAWAQVVARMSGREDVVFGTVLLGRMQGGEGTDRILGPCINTLPIRILVENISVQESVRHTHSVLAQLMRHEHASLAVAQRCSAVAAPAPLFSSILNYRHSKDARQTLAMAGGSADSHNESVWLFEDIEGREFLNFMERTNYPFELTVDDFGESFRLNAQVESPVDPERVCAYMHTALEQLVVALESSPAAPLRSLDVLPDAERRQVVVEWNDTARNYGHEARLHRLIERQAAQTPDCVALEFEGQTLSYLEVNERANQLARLLRRKGVGPDVLVGVFAERSFEMVLALLATLKAGGAYVPLDPSYPAERLAHMLEDARTLLVLAQPHLASQLPPQAKEVHLLDGSWAAYAHESGEDLEDIGTPQNLAYVIFTSGSTGRPKGAMNEHGGICNRLLWMQEEYGLSADDRVLQKTQFSFDVSTWEFFWPLLAGARLVIARPEGHRDSAYLKGLIRECGITALHFVPSMLRVFLEQEGLEGCCSLKRVFCSGEALPHELQERFFARLPEVELHNLYGPTEAAVDVTYWACRKGDDCLTVPIGRPVANTQMYALDARMRPAPVGVAGELYIGGVQVGRGYVGRDDLTAERFVADPFSKTPDARLYKTGDLARHLPDGAIEYLGRLDYQVKIRGQRIELGEIEATLDKHAGVGQSVVMAREDTPGDQRLVAYVVARQAASSTEELREHLSRQLPAYMVPSAFVFLEALPLTSSGKVDRKLLPVPERSGSEATYVAPRTVTEEILAGIWSRVLGLERVGVHDNFFELGGHSLLATRLISRIRDAFQVELPLRCLFEAATVASLAENIETALRPAQAIQTPSLLPVSRKGNLALSFAQQRLWFLDQLEPGSAAYNIATSLRLRGPLNREALEQSLNELLRRHEVLRTAFGVVDGQPVQIITPTLTVSLAVSDLQELPKEEREAEVRRRVTQEAQTPLNLAQGSLARFILLRLDEAEHILLLTLHHIVSDEWSMDVFFRELTALYEAFATGKPSPLTELPIQYVDFALWQRQWLEGEILDKQLAYWRKKLADLPVLELPTDQPRPSVQSYHGVRQSVVLSKTLTEALKALSRQQGVTLFMTLLSAFKVLLHHHTNQQDIIVGSPIAGRSWIETEGLIGCFANTVVLRTDVSDDPTFSELLVKVREMVLQAHAHQDMPFERLVRELQPRRDLSRNPLFQVWFVFRNALSLSSVGSGLNMSVEEIDVSTTKYDLKLDVSEIPEGLQATFVCNKDLFTASFITLLATHFEALLNVVTQQPFAKLATLREVLARVEEQQFIVKEKESKETSLRRLKNIKRQPVQIGQAQKERLNGKSELSS